MPTRREHYYMEIEHGTSRIKCSFWANPDKYQAHLFSILGIDKVTDSDLKSLVKTRLSKAGAIRLFVLAEKNTDQKIVRLWCAPQKVATALNSLRGKIIYNGWTIIDAFLALTFDIQP